MVLAVRTLTYHSDLGDVPVPISISAPETGIYGWKCDYKIAWPHEAYESAGWGFDAVQAIHLTLEKIGIELYTSEYHHSGRLSWTERGKGYGFPVPSNGRDLLIGDDKRFFG